MHLDVLQALGLIVVLGIGAQWLGRSLRFPSIVLLLVAGVLVGPVTGLVEPAELFGELLDPVVSLAVGLILFEAGFSLDLREIGVGRRVVWRLVTIGVALTAAFGAVASKFLLDLDWQVAILLGAILVVSGPTVVTLLLREMRIREPLNAILRWEGIVIDPIGATLGLVVLHLVTSDSPHVFAAALDLLATLATGTAIGVAGAALLVPAFRWYRVPDDLQVAVALALAVAVFVTAESVFSEAGLFATTAFGLALRNQRFADVSRVRSFQEDLSAIILGMLFIVLAADVTLAEFRGVVWGSVALTGVLVLVVRPLAVAASTIRTDLTWRDRAFAAALAPRGIVAASTSATFAVAMADAGYADADVIPAATFVVIVTAGVVYGFAARPVARLLGVASPAARGLAIVSDEHWARVLADALVRLGGSVLLVAAGREDVRLDPTVAYSVFVGSLDSEDLDGALEEADVATALVASVSPERNVFATSELMGRLGREAVYHLPPEGGHEPGRAADLWAGTPDAHKAFDPTMTIDHLRTLVTSRAALRTFSRAEGMWEPDDKPGPGPGSTLPLFVVDADGQVRVVTLGGDVVDQAGGGARLLTLAVAGGLPGGASAERETSV
ncbi:MAG: sodium:proton antiporter [Acidimicrobiia bacterium]|nr:sodium:proton antiporter [Acidimicrobiia bacterium]